MSRAPLLAAGALLGFIVLLAGGLGYRPWNQIESAPRPAMDAPSAEPVVPAAPSDSITVGDAFAPSACAESLGVAPDGPLEQPDSLPRPSVAVDSI